MSLILESDIIYNILPHVDLPTIGTLLCINKFVNKLCNDKHFWKNKIKYDYKNVIPKSDEWLYEYKCIYEIYVRSIKFVDDFIVDGLTHTPVRGYRGTGIHVRELINLDHFRWISQISHLKLGSQATVSFFVYNHEIVSVVLNIYIGTISNGPCILYLLRGTFIDYIINLHYNHHDIHMDSV